jgi:LysM repeat protein
MASFFPVGSFAATDLRAEVVSQREDLRLMQEKVGQAQNDLQAMKGENAELQKDVDRLKAEMKSVNTSLDDMKKDISRLEEMIRKLDAAREQDRKTIIEEVGKEIDTLSRKVSRAETSRAEKSPKQVVQEGVEHIVEKGQTLNAIAETYGVSKKTIMEANKLTKSDLKVGQKLFIPTVPEKKDKSTKSKKSTTKSD